jgi:hypothetical protein
MTKAEEFLERVYAEKRDSHALDIIFRGLDDLLDGYTFAAMDRFMVEHGGVELFGEKAENPNFEAVDEIFKALDLERVSVSVMLGFLGAPFTARRHLKEYRPLLDRIRDHLAKTEPPERLKALLQGFDR